MTSNIQYRVYTPQNEKRMNFFLLKSCMCLCIRAENTQHLNLTMLNKEMFAFIFVMTKEIQYLLNSRKIISLPANS